MNVALLLRVRRELSAIRDKSLPESGMVENGEMGDGAGCFVGLFQMSVLMNRSIGSKKIMETKDRMGEGTF